MVTIEDTPMKTTIYILSYNDYDENGAIAAFTSTTKAEAFMRKLMEYGERMPLSIDGYELDVTFEEIYGEHEENK